MPRLPPLIELSLKHLIPLAHQVIEREMSQSQAALLKTSHSLRVLWTIFKSLEAEASAKSGVAVNTEDRQGIESYIEQYHEVDEGSFAFRYPLTKQGDVALGDFTHIHLGTLSVHMEKLCEYLDGLAIGYSEFVKYQSEMNGEIGGDAYD